MDADRYRRAEALFHAALDRPAAERAAFLDDACDDAALRADVERLLAADAEADDALLDGPALALPEDATSEIEEGRQIGPYRVVRPLGRGGMGEVLLAVREAPYRRTVALKLARDGARSDEARARFAVERQVLASLDHAGIARLYDGGVTDAGAPYLAMEVVDGKPITDYCDERRLGVEDRLRLFVRVCEAVHYAHQNLVLHRDLKPSNILVTASGEVKLLDFGIAKLLDPEASGIEAPETRTGARLLTPEYASPEQVRGESLSTASDVYSLGVVLYELLTGRRPHRLAGRTTEDVIRTVSETPPTSPSTVVTRAPESVADFEAAPVPTEAAARRGLTPDRLGRRLAGDLDAICLRALRKEPGRRYGSAELFAQDVERHLARQPVLARRGTRRYRLGAFLRRHRIEAAAALAVLVALVGGLGAALWQAGEASRERDLARTEAAKSEEVAAFLTGLFEQGDPTQAVGDTVTVREVLDDAVARIDDLDSQPEVQGALLAILADAYLNLGRSDAARPLAERALAVRLEALGDDHPDTADSRIALARIYLAGLADGTAEPTDSDDAIRLLGRSVEDAERLHGPESPEVLVALDDYAMSLHLGGRNEAAGDVRQRWRDLIDRGTDVDHPQVAASLTDYAQILIVQRDQEGAERYLRRAVAMSRRVSGDTSQAVGFQLGHLALALSAQGKHDEALALGRESVAINEVLHPEGHREVSQSHAQLGQILIRQERYDEAEDELMTHLDMTQRLHPEGGLPVGRAYYYLAVLEGHRGRFDEAVAWQRQSAEAFEATMGADNFVAVRARVVLSGYLTDAGRYAEAERILLRALAHVRVSPPAMSVREDDLKERLVALYEAWGRPASAAPYRASPEAAEGGGHGG